VPAVTSQGVPAITSQRNGNLLLQRMKMQELWYRLDYFYYKHCICNNTQRKGFFNRTHTSTATATTLGHTFPRSDDANTATADETASL